MAAQTTASLAERSEDESATGGSAALWRIALVVFGLALVVRGVFLFQPGFAIDQAQFMAWSRVAQSDGVAAVYALREPAGGKRVCNYPPGYIYVLAVLARVYGWAAPDGAALDDAVWTGVLTGQTTPATQLATALYKTPGVLADVTLAALLVVWVGRRRGWRAGLAAGGIYAVMPASIHNAAMWGQVDAVPTLLVVASLEMARRKRLGAMCVLAALALLTKAQTAAMLPLWAAALVSVAGRQWRRWIAALAPALGVAVVVLLPFARTIDGVWDAYAAATRYYPFTHLNGFSAWFLGHPLDRPHLGDDLGRYYARDDLPGFLGVAPHWWGFAAVLGLWVYVLVVMWHRRGDERSLLWAARVLPLAFFVLSTQMHERYLLPAVGIWAWTCGGSRRLWTASIVLGLCASINAMWVWTGPEASAWAPWLRQWLHGTWLGLGPGVWCSLALVGLLIGAMVGWIDGCRTDLPRRAS